MISKLLSSQGIYKRSFNVSMKLMPNLSVWSRPILRAVESTSRFGKSITGKVQCRSLKTHCSTAPSKYAPNILTISLGSSFGIGLVGFSRIKSNVLCERNPNKVGRLTGIQDGSKNPEPKFQWKEFFQLLLPDILYLLAAVATALAVAVVNIKIPLLLGDVVNVVSRYTVETADNFMAEMKEPAKRLIGLYAVQSVLTFQYIICLSKAGERMAARLRKKLFQSIISQDISFFDEHKTGEIVNRLTTDIQDFKSSFKLCISQGLRSFTQLVGCAGSLLIISPKLTSLLFIVVPSIVLFGTGIGSLLRSLSRKAQAQVAKATAVADEAIGNVRTVRAFAMEGKEMELYNSEVDKSAVMNVRLGLGIGAFQALSNLALNGIVLGTLYLGGSLMAEGTLRAGDLMSFMVATQTVQRSMAQMSLLFGQAVRGFSAGARVFEYLELKPYIPLTGGDKIPYHSFHGGVEFKNVTFSYPTRPGQKVLENFSLDLPAGRMVALCGASGGGKSTIAGLLERFYDVDSGSIKVDGRDLQSLDASWLRGRAIGYINQEPILFATSVRENIRYGKPEATDQEVEEAAKLANAHGFITSFPQGYKTILGERGVTVSGGQKQRIAIARALIKNPSILILDEATSALDAESERVVQSALDSAVKGRTVLIIAHRLSTIRDADLIAVVANGRITEIGTHTELKKKGGQYWNLIRQQESKESRGLFGQG